MQLRPPDSYARVFCTTTGWHDPMHRKISYGYSSQTANANQIWLARCLLATSRLLNSWSIKINQSTHRNAVRAPFVSSISRLNYGFYFSFYVSKSLTAAKRGHVHWEGHRGDGVFEAEVRDNYETRKLVFNRTSFFFFCSGL